MKEKISLNQIKKIINIIESIVYEQMTLKPDGRIIANKERALENTLNTITSDIKRQIEIQETISNGLLCEGITYKAICEEFRKLGYEIIEGD